MYPAWPSPSASNRCSASRLVRLDTGSSSEAVLASQTVVMAKGTGLTSSWRATAMTTGVSSTAVVSRLSTVVAPTDRATTSSHSAQVRCRPAREAQWPATSNTPAASAISATTVIATRKTSTGPTRVARSTSSAPLTPACSCCGGLEHPGLSGPARLGQVGLELAREHVGQRPRGAGIDAGEAQVPGHQAAGVLGHVRRPGHHDLHPPGGELTLGSPRRGIRAGTAVHDDPSARDRREHPGERLAPERGQRAELTEVDAHGQAVGGYLVGRAQGAVEGGDDEQPAAGAAQCRGVE